MRKTVSCIVLFLVMIWISTLSVSATGQETLKLSVQTVSAEREKEFDVTVSITETTGFIGLNLYLIYPKELSFVKATSQASDLVLTQGKTLVFDGVKDYTQTGNLLTLTFTLSADAIIGESYEIQLMCTEAFNEADRDLDVQLSSGSVTVLCTHNYGSWISEVPATCTEDGMLGHYHCSVCNKDFDVSHNELTSLTISPKGHSLGNWLETKTPTCTKKGTEKRACSACSYYETREKDALGHDFEMGWTVDKKATCTTAGSKSHHCSRCNEISNVTVIDSSGHYLGAWAEIVTPTCETKGTEKRTCSECSYFETREKNALGHDFSSAWATDKQPTCTEAGSKSHHCSRCTEISDVTVIEPSGHNYGRWKETVSPTCTEKGEEKRGCSECEHYETREVDALGHLFGEWIAEVPATKNNTGTKAHYHCSECGSNFDRSHEEITDLTIPMLLSDPSNNPPTEPSPPDKEENTLSTGAVVAIAAGSVVVVAGGGFSWWWFVLRKKKLL